MNFLEIPISQIYENERYPDTDTHYIYEHLKYFCSHPSMFPLPAIHVSFVDGRLVVTGGHKYLRIARELGVPTIRSILSADGSRPMDFLAALPSGIRVIPKEELQREEEIKVVDEYHVYFFESPLGPKEQQRFLNEIAGFFQRLKSPSISGSQKRVIRSAFPYGAQCGEFEATIPVGDMSWCEEYLNVCRRFSRQVRRIVSFQGGRFPA